MARGTFVPPNFRVDVPSEDELVAVGVVWGLSLPLTVFGIFRCVRQTYSQYRRTKRVNLYMLLIWLELISTTLMGGTAWGYVRGMWYFLGAVIILWIVQINAILQIILNRISLISDNKPYVRRVQWFLFGSVLLLQVAVACVWIPAQLQISDLYVDVNHVFDRTEKVIFALIDLCLNVYFIHLVRSTLIAYGLTKYVLLYRVNIAMILVSMTMDIRAVPPLAYLIKLHIELSMAELIAKIVKASSRSRSCLCPCTEADNDILVVPTTGRVSGWGPFRRLRETRAVDQTTATSMVVENGNRTR
uniref:Integral membrane protein n=1 Tax=Bionectria ochroleuca TaxID=29856 RepID=A0A8H7KDQ3_BIOOC